MAMIVGTAPALQQWQTNKAGFDNLIQGLTQLMPNNEPSDKGLMNSFRGQQQMSGSPANSFSGSELRNVTVPTPIGMPPQFKGLGSLSGGMGGAGAMFGLPF